MWVWVQLATLLSWSYLSQLNQHSAECSWLWPWLCRRNRIWRNLTANPCLIWASQQSTKIMIINYVEVFHKLCWVISVNESCDIQRLPDWKNVLVDKSIRWVAHGSSLKIECKGTHINIGGRNTTCSNGTFQILPEGSEPNCATPGMYICIGRRTWASGSKILKNH